MDPIEKQERKREARRRAQAQRERARRLRLRVLAGSLIGFVLLWGIVFGQMLTGNDPVLSGKSSSLTASAERRHATASGAGATALVGSNGDDEAGEGAERAGEAIETTDPEEIELVQAAEREAAESAEAVEVEPEPVTTSQS